MMEKMHSLVATPLTTASKKLLKHKWFFFNFWSYCISTNFWNHQIGKLVMTVSSHWYILNLVIWEEFSQTKNLFCAFEIVEHVFLIKFLNSLLLNYFEHCIALLSYYVVKCWVTRILLLLMEYEILPGIVWWMVLL